MSSRSERIAILAPFGRDGLLLQQALRKQKFETEVYVNFEALCTSLIHEAPGAVLIGDEVLGPEQVAVLGEMWSGQPAWSDLSLLIMTRGGLNDLARQRRMLLLEPLEATMTLLERPLRSAILVSVVQSALRARRRQYEIRDLLERERRNALSLQSVNSSLRQSNERLAEFAYAVSHDLQEPLRTVSAYTQLLARRYKGQLGPEADEYIQFVTEGAFRMRQLISDLLDYSQVTSREVDPHTLSDANEAIASVRENLRVLIDETATKICAGTLPCLGVEIRQLTQLFQNLIENAIKYRRSEQTPKISIDATPSGTFWLFRVKDNGVGFDQSFAEQIFGLFKRLQRTDQQGTGIGLALCRRIVERYGGRIWAESTVGRGTTFSFLLPACEQRESS